MVIRNWQINSSDLRVALFVVLITLSGFTVSFSMMESAESPRTAFEVFYCRRWGIFETPRWHETDDQREISTWGQVRVVMFP